MAAEDAKLFYQMARIIAEIKSFVIRPSPFDACWRIAFRLKDITNAERLSGRMSQSCGRVRASRAITAA
jgi:hypothetical protein